MELQDLIQFANDYARLGGAVQVQATDMLIRDDYSDINPNAASLIEQLLRDWGFDEEADEMMENVEDY